VPPRNITEITNPGRTEIIPVSDASSRQARVGSRLAVLFGRNTEMIVPDSVNDIDMNVAETYGIDWDSEKCGRDAFQNFFDANGGTLDGVRSYTEQLAPSPEDGRPLYAVSIEGDSDYDYRELTVIGATSKQTGETTAGGFGEGAKFLALSLLRDHEVDAVVYRSRDWQLEFYVDELPEDKVVRPTRGLYARVVSGLEYTNGSSMVITSKNKDTVEAIAGGRQLFRSSENPDFQDNTLVKTLPDGTQIGVKFTGIDNRNEYVDRTNKGRLYIAGQRRHYAAYGEKKDTWDTLDGISVWTNKDIAPGDRDRGALSKATLTNEIFTPLAQSLDENEVRAFFRDIEPAYGESKSAALITEIGILGDLIATRGKELGVKMDFDPKYVAVTAFLDMNLSKAIKDAGYTTCPGYYAKVGMKSHSEVLKSLHEHQRVEPSAEQQARIDLLQEGLAVMTSAQALKKEIKPKEIWLYSKQLEKNPFDGTASDEWVWISEEHLEKEFAAVFATYLHELDHEAGTDQSADFSYALTDTLAEVIHIFSSNPQVMQAFQHLTHRWQTLQTLKKYSGQPDEPIWPTSSGDILQQPTS
jgi:hypothetical protein